MRHQTDRKFVLGDLLGVQHWRQRYGTAPDGRKPRLSKKWPCGHPAETARARRSRIGALRPRAGLEPAEREVESADLRLVETLVELDSVIDGKRAERRHVAYAGAD